MRKRIWLLVGISVLGLSSGICHYSRSRPEVHLSCRSADKEWGARLERSRFLIEVHVTLHFLDRSGNSTSSSIIDRRDTWHEVEERYFSMRCEEEGVVLENPVWTGEKYTERFVAKP